jgi:hypothetical protein
VAVGALITWFALGQLWARRRDREEGNEIVRALNRKIEQGEPPRTVGGDDRP